MINEFDKFEGLFVTLIEYIEIYPDFSIQMLKILQRILQNASEVETYEGIVKFICFLPSLENFKFSKLFI